ncbi:BTAD domain-containing putative transcriptional regulator [Actinomadura kijaniata]|uniref:AfsR/SARP family transcriptional regulator n=1 Tax=Actinomadura kijaniata TaxID=46161 RepID=UPI003F1D9053
MTNAPFLRFAVLGPVRAWRNGEPSPEELALGGPQQRALLAALLLRSGRAVPIGTLVASVWGEEPPVRAVGTLRTYVSRLRRVLENDRTRPAVLRSAGDGYRLDVPDGALDLTGFDRRVAEAARRTAGGRSRADLDAARLLLTEALALWSGEPLAGLPGPFAETQRARLAERRLAARRSRLEIDLELGRYAEAVAELTALTAEHPLREDLHGLLMLALSRDGRQAEALAAYAALHRTLRSELGTDPGPELRRLHARLLAGDPAPPAPGPGPVARPASLPAALADFTGRAGLVARLTARLTAPPGAAPTVIALTGAGGVGKTALAVHVAHRVRDDHPDGQLYADLQGVGERPAEPAAVLGEFLRALGVPDAALPESEAERAALYRTRLAGRRVLVLLDNARDAEQVRPLLPGDPGCAVLVTGRAHTAAPPGAWSVPLRAFAADEASALFTSIVGEERAAAEPAAAAEVLRLCGHLPLAVRIVAARLAARPGWTVAALARRLADDRRRLTELRAGDLTVEATFRLGYDQLDERQRRAFRLLALPETAGIAPAAAAALLGEPAGPLLDSLVDLGLLDAPTPGRYRYHDLLWLFARQTAEREDGPAERHAALTRLLEFLAVTQRRALRLVRPGSPAADGPDGGPAFASADAARAWTLGELPDLLALVRQVARDPLHAAPHGPGDALAGAAGLLFALDPVLEDGYRWSEVEPAARAVLAAAVRRGDARAEARARHALGRLFTHTSRLPAAREHAERAVALARAADDAELLAAALDLLAHVAFYEHDLTEAIALLEESRDLARRLGDAVGEVERTASIAYALVERGAAGEGPRDDVVRAEAVADHARGLARAHGHAAAEAYALYILGIALREQGRLDEAVARFDDGLAISWSQGLRARESYLLLRIAETQLLRGRPRQALTSAGKSLAIGREIGEEYQQGRALVALGHAHAALHAPGPARARWREALTLFERLGVAEAASVRSLLTGARASPST